MEKVILNLLKEIDFKFVYIFGSFVNNKQTEESDIDIAFYSDDVYDEYKIFMIAQKISKKLKRDIDLIQIKKASTVFQKEIISKGKLIYEKNMTERQRFELLILKKYTLLNEEREEILKNYSSEMRK